MSKDSQLAGGRAPAPRKTIAHTMLIDTRNGDVVIDGVTLPWWVASEPTIEPAEHPAFPSLVTLEMHVDNVFVIRTLEEDLQQIRDLGAKQRSEAVLKFQAECEVRQFKERAAAQEARNDARHYPKRAKLRGVAAVLAKVSE